MKNNLHPCLWFDGNAKEAAMFYCQLFKNSKLTVDTPMVVNFELEGQKFMGLNGGPKFKFNPAVSLFVISESDDEINELWKKLSAGGLVMMPLDKYDWSEKYAFVQDRFGLSWQIMKGKYSDVNQKITPSFLFTGEQYGHAEARCATTEYQFHVYTLPMCFLRLRELNPPERPLPNNSLVSIEVQTPRPRPSCHRPFHPHRTIARSPGPKMRARSFAVCVAYATAPVVLG